MAILALYLESLLHTPNSHLFNLGNQRFTDLKGAVFSIHSKMELLKALLSGNAFIGIKYLLAYPSDFLTDEPSGLVTR